MKCSKCGRWNDRVTNSRLSLSGVTVKRRRECMDCGFRFTTHEVHMEQYEKLLRLTEGEL